MSDPTRNALDPGPDEVYTTADVLRRYSEPSWLQQMANWMPSNPDHQLSLVNILKGGATSAANWLAGKPRIGPDTLAPLGAGGMLAMTARPASKFARPSEWPTEAAIKWGDDHVFTGPNHALILMNADLRKVPQHLNPLDGFVTNAGRFITREEASRMTGAPRVVRNGMVSEALATGLDGPRRTGQGFGSTSITMTGLPIPEYAVRPQKEDDPWAR